MRSLGFIIAIAILAAAAFGAGWYAANQFANPPSGGPLGAEPGEPFALQKVVAQGRLVPYGGFSNVVIPPGQRIEKLLVAEGDVVEAGTTRVAVLAGDEILKKQIELAEARTADAKIEMEQNLLRAENQVLAAQTALQSAELQLSQARQQADFAVQENRIEQAAAKLERFERLLADAETSRLVSAYQIQDQRLEVEAARLQMAHARSLADQTIETASLSVKNAQQQLDSAMRARDAAKAGLDAMRSLKVAESLATMQWAAQQVVAPKSGTVIRLFAKQGEALQNTPLLQIGDLSKMECVAEVSDRLVPLVTEGQRAIIKSPALSQPFSGRVTHVGTMVGAGTLVDPNPLAMVDQRTVEVRIELDPESVAEAKQLINLQVTVEIALTE